MDKKNKEADVMDGILTYLLTLASTENVLQSIKEVLTLHQNFNPFTLFNYISQSATVITKDHITDFLAENGLAISEQLVRVFLVSNGFKDKLTYTQFLNYVYPVSAQVLRQISTNQIKKYSKTEKTSVNQQVLCCFLMLLDQEIEFIKTFQDLKREQPLAVTREKLKKIFKTIKKASEKQTGVVGELSAENIITHAQLKSFVKLYHKVQDHEMLNLGRRLSMGKEGIIGLEEFDFWLKPWKRQRNQDQQRNNNNSRNTSERKIALSRTKRTASQVQPPVLNYQQPHEDIFIHYISKFLEVEKQTENLKNVLTSKSDFDIMILFKQFDKKSCGVISKQDIEQIYSQITGQILDNSDLIINKFSAGRGVLSISQFSEIFRCSAEDSHMNSRKSALKTISNSTIKIALQIIKINIRSQEKLQNILRKIQKPQIKKMFQKINQDGNGFISYQQLKGYLSSNGMQLPMGDLMSILKRFDKNKNGVIVQEDFTRVLVK